MDSHATFEGFLRTGSGSEQVILELGEHDAKVVIEYRWMGQGDEPPRCESQLAAMRPAGYATWNEHFDILLLPEPEGWPEEPLWEHIRIKLDKAKLLEWNGNVTAFG